MKKNLLKWTTILMVAIVSVGFSSCGGDNDSDDYNPEANKSGIIGTWVDGSTTVTFGSDGSYNLTDTSIPSITQYRHGTYTYDSKLGIVTVDVEAVEGQNGAYQQIYIVQTLTATTLVLLYVDGDVEGYYTRK